MKIYRYTRKTQNMKQILRLSNPKHIFYYYLTSIKESSNLHVTFICNDCYYHFYVMGKLVIYGTCRRVSILGTVSLPLNVLQSVNLTFQFPWEQEPSSFVFVILLLCRDPGYTCYSTKSLLTLSWWSEHCSHMMHLVRSFKLRAITSPS